MPVVSDGSSLDLPFPNIESLPNSTRPANSGKPRRDLGAGATSALGKQRPRTRQEWCIPRSLLPKLNFVLTEFSFLNLGRLSASTELWRRDYFLFFFPRLSLEWTFYCCQTAK
jgi:hypothetical protein